MPTEENSAPTDLDRRDGSAADDSPPRLSEIWLEMLGLSRRMAKRVMQSHRDEVEKARHEAEWWKKKHAEDCAGLMLQLRRTPDTARLDWLIKQGPPGAADGFGLNDECWECACAATSDDVATDNEAVRAAIDAAMNTPNKPSDQP